MDENNIVTGFSPLVTDHEIYAELYYYDGSGILHMPHGAKGIAAGAFQE
ncbi:MAG: hypothetical protein MJ233_04100 [Mycoplasmoidaceae bacterium]|nr:hypothetical protein [Mycoplasmoidaceae bacterium]